MQGRRKLCAALTGAVLFVVPASAQAAITATVTGDDGNPVALNAAAPLALRNMDVKVNAHVDQAEDGRWSLTIFGPDSVPAASASTCNIVQYTQDVRKFVTFRGNGTYTGHRAALRATRRARRRSSRSSSSTRSTASVAIGQPPGAGLTRQPGSLSTITHALDFAPNPGAISYEIKYAKGGVIDPAPARSPASRRTRT